MIWVARLILFRYPDGSEQMGLFQATGASKTSSACSALQWGLTPAPAGFP